MTRVKGSFRGGLSLLIAVCVTVVATAPLWPHTHARPAQHTDPSHNHRGDIFLCAVPGVSLDPERPCALCTSKRLLDESRLGGAATVAAPSLGPVLLPDPTEEPTAGGALFPEARGPPLY